MEISGRSRLLVIVGDPVDHSLSPAMHNAAIRALGLDAVYVAIRADAVSITHVMRAFEAIGIAGNVTVPHKITVASLLIRLTGAAKELGAVNTFWPEHGRLIGDNTDLRGVSATTDALGADGPWLVAGTGGAARAVAAAARDRDVPLLVRSRTRQTTNHFVEWARELGVAKVAADDGAPVAVAINATPVGLGRADGMAFEKSVVDRSDSAFDMVYAAHTTRLVALFQERGKPAADGRQMLVEQGAAAFERFFPDQHAPHEVMVAAVARAR